jgi:hypothetical protein
VAATVATGWPEEGIAVRRFSISLVVVAIALLGMTTVGRGTLGTVAQEATPVVGPVGPHPIVGSWLADTDADDPSNPPALFTFHADGTYFQSEVDGVGVGAWVATGARTADLTIHSVSQDESGAVIMFTVRASIEVASDGQSFTATYTLELTLPDGTSTGEYGPGTATGTRIAVEPMGEPEGSIGDLFALFSEPPETPVAADLEAYDIGWRTADEPGPSVTLTVAAGDTIEVANVGTADHNFTVEALGIDVDLPPGESATVTIPAETAPGEYEFICNVPGHAAAGMVGTLIVG